MFIVNLMLAVVSSAQLPKYQLNRIQEEAGLKTTGVINITKDKKGFLWIATQNNVQLFDGRHALRFSFAGTVTGVYADDANRVWALTKGGIYLLTDYAKGFRRINFEGKNSGDADIKLFETAGKLFAQSSGNYYLVDRKKAYRYFQQTALMHSFQNNGMD